MPISDADLWHQVHAQREDGVAAMFLIRDVEPRADQPLLFVIELPYPITDPSKLPDAAGYRRLDTFQEEWVEPACEALGWTFVAWKSEDGSFFLYLYGDGDPNVLLERLAPFDDALSYFNDRDAEWSEYATLRELVEQAQAAPQDEDEGDHVHTADCDHEQDADGAAQAIPVIDLTGGLTGGTDERDEQPSKPRTMKTGTLKPARPAKAAIAKARPAKPKPTKAKATTAKATKTKATTAKATTAKATTAKATTAKATTAKATKSASSRPASVKASPTASRATSRPAPRPAATARKPRK